MPGYFRYKLWIAAGMFGGVGAAALLASCASSSSAPAPVKQVAAADFASPGAEGVRSKRAAQVATPAATQAQPAAPVVVVMGAPANPLAAGVAPAPAAAREGKDERLAVDQLVGQINGRPVFANEFFAPMDARLRRNASEMTDRQWVTETRKAIDAALWDRLRDQLLLAEFESSLTPDQKMGLFAFVDSIRSDLVSGNLGSEEQTNEKLLATEQVDLDTKVADISKRVFIREQIRKEILSRVQVSFWDVRLYYEQHLDEFAPPPVAKFRIIQVPATDPEKIARIEAALDAGEEFADVAARESAWRPNAANSHDVMIASREYTAERYFGPEPLNAAVIGLAPGEVTNRVDLGGDCWWIRLDAIHQPEGRTLYEAQSQIEEIIRADRSREEEIRYFAELFKRGSFSDVQQMSARLLQFAAERYLIQDRMTSREDASSPEPAAQAPAEAP